VYILGRMEDMRCGLLCGASVSLSVSLFVTRLCTAKTAKRIEVLFGVETLWAPKNIVLDVGFDPRTGRGTGEMSPTLACIGI